MARATPPRLSLAHIANAITNRIEVHLGARPTVEVRSSGKGIVLVTARLGDREAQTATLRSQLTRAVATLAEVLADQLDSD